ncbi:MAG: hypothetical protein ACLQVI_36525 [Polyangiaceae bacterium]
MVKIALALMGLTVLGALVTAVVLSGREAGGALVQLGAASSTALAWGAGVLLAMPASLEAFRDDRRNGIRALLRARGASTTAYAQGRVLGLALVLFVVVGGGTLVSGGAAFLLASRLGVAAHALGGLAAALVYAAAYALVVAPMSLAALGGRRRTGGFFRFAAVVLVPVFLERWTSSLVPAGWGDVLSLPAALNALRAALLTPGIDVARLARAAIVLAAFAALCFVLVLAEISALDAEQAQDEVRP